MLGFLFATMGAGTPTTVAPAATSSSLTAFAPILAGLPVLRFLGVGKITLINHILKGQHDRKVAVIVDEFGEISINGQSIISDNDEQLVEFNNGCLCCPVRGDLMRTLADLMQTHANFW
jgi:hypothetical protein